MARDDFKSDKAHLQLSYSLLMVGVCTYLADPGRLREVPAYLEVIFE